MAKKSGHDHRWERRELERRLSRVPKKPTNDRNELATALAHRFRADLLGMSRRRLPESRRILAGGHSATDAEGPDRSTKVARDQVRADYKVVDNDTSGGGNSFDYGRNNTAASGF